MKCTNVIKFKLLTCPTPESWKIHDFRVHGWKVLGWKFRGWSLKLKCSAPNCANPNMHSIDYENFQEMTLYFLGLSLFWSDFFPTILHWRFLWFTLLLLILQALCKLSNLSYFAQPMGLKKNSILFVLNSFLRPSDKTWKIALTCKKKRYKLIYEPKSVPKRYSKFL